MSVYQYTAKSIHLPTRIKQLEDSNLLKNYIIKNNRRWTKNPFIYTFHKGYTVQVGLAICRGPLKYSAPDFLVEHQRFIDDWLKKTGNEHELNDSIVYMNLPKHFLKTEVEREIYIKRREKRHERLIVLNSEAIDFLKQTIKYRHVKNFEDEIWSKFSESEKLQKISDLLASGVIGLPTDWVHVFSTTEDSADSYGLSGPSAEQIDHETEMSTIFGECELLEESKNSSIKTRRKSLEKKSDNPSQKSESIQPKSHEDTVFSQSLATVTRDMSDTEILAAENIESGGEMDALLRSEKSFINRLDLKAQQDIIELDKQRKLQSLLNENDGSEVYETDVEIHDAPTLTPSIDHFYEGYRDDPEGNNKCYFSQDSEGISQHGNSSSYRDKLMVNKRSHKLGLYRDKLKAMRGDVSKEEYIAKRNEFFGLIRPIETKGATDPSREIQISPNSRLPILYSHSLVKQPYNHLWLIVKYRHHLDEDIWELPKMFLPYGEGIEPTLKNICKSHLGVRFFPYFVGHSPFAFGKYRHRSAPVNWAYDEKLREKLKNTRGTKIFYFKGYHVPGVTGNVDLLMSYLRTKKIIDFKWVDRKHLEKFLTPEEWERVQYGINLE